MDCLIGKWSTQWRFYYEQITEKSVSPDMNSLVNTGDNCESGISPENHVPLLWC